MPAEAQHDRARKSRPSSVYVPGREDCLQLDRGIVKNEREKEKLDSVLLVELRVGSTKL